MIFNHLAKGGDYDKHSAFGETVDKRGLKYKFLADCIGITPYGLQKKIENLSEFKASEIVALCEALQLIEMSASKFFYEEGGD